MFDTSRVNPFEQKSKKSIMKISDQCFKCLTLHDGFVYYPDNSM